MRLVRWMVQELAVLAAWAAGMCVVAVVLFTWADWIVEDWSGE